MSDTDNSDTIRSRLVRRVRDRTAGATNRALTPTVEFTAELADAIDHSRREIIETRPPRESRGLDTSHAFVGALYHSPSILGDTPTYSLTPTYSRGTISLYASAPTGRVSDLREAVTNYYPGATIRSVSDANGGLSIDEGHYVAGAKIRTHRDCVHPLRTKKSSDPLDSDPHTSLLPPLVGDNDETACLQAVFEPVGASWFSRGLINSSGDRVVESLRKGESVGELNPRVVKTDKSKRAVKDVGRQSGRDAFAVSLRVLAAAPTREAASRRITNITKNLNVVANPDTGQELTPRPKSGRDLRALIKTVGGRWPDYQSAVGRFVTGRPTVLTDHELGDFLVHFPTKDDVQAPIEWSEQTESERIPADAY